MESTQKEKLSEAPPVDFQREPASVEKELPSPSILALKEKFSTIIEGETILKDDTIIINYPQSNFFDSSSHRLNEEGKALVKEVIQKLSVHKNDVYVSVQGHTDPKNFKITMTRNLSDNWELSVLRATTVLKELIREGFNPGYLMAEGYSFKNTKLNPQSDDRYMRKVTFKIRQRKR